MLMSISTEDLFAMALTLVKNSKTPLDCIACQTKVGAQWVKKLLEQTLLLSLYLSEKSRNISYFYKM